MQYRLLEYSEFHPVLVLRPISSSCSARLGSPGVVVVVGFGAIPFLMAGFMISVSISDQVLISLSQ